MPTSKTSSTSSTPGKSRNTNATPNARKPMKQLQARLEGKTFTVTVKVDERHMKLLRGIQTFCGNGMHLDPSTAVVIARALEVYFWTLGDKLIDVRVKEEAGELSPDGFLLSFADALYQERIALLTTANRLQGADSDLEFQTLPKKKGE